MTLVYHVFANKINMGDWASALGVRLYIDKHLKGPVSYRDIFCLDPVSNKIIDEINNNADAVVIGGGGVWFHKNNKSGWLWNIAPEQFESIRKPLIFYAVGLNEDYKRNAEWKLQKHDIENVMKAVDRSSLVGVRDHWTLKWLHKQGYEHAQLVPCPSTMLKLDRDAGVSNSAPEGKKQIGINLVPEEKMMRFRLLKDSLELFLDPYVKDGYSLCYIANNTSKLENSAQKMNQSLKGEVFLPHSPFELINILHQSEFNVVMRGHAILLSYAARRPAINISYNKKCESFAETINMLDYTMRWKPTLFGNRYLYAMKLRTIAEKMRHNISYIESDWERVRVDIDRKNNLFAAKIAKLIE